MKKTALLILLALLALGGTAFGHGVDYQVGVGYSGMFMGDEADPSAFPFGFELFGGVGYAFTDNLAAGFEYNFARSWAVEDLGYDVVRLTENMPRAYFRFYSPMETSLTALMGMDIMTVKADDEKLSTESAFVMGLRLSLLMGYFQYSAVFEDGETYNRFGLGIHFGDTIMLRRPERTE